MRTSALQGPNNGGDFHQVMGQQEREHCRLDLDKVIDARMDASHFIEKWQDALRVILLTRL